MSNVMGIDVSKLSLEVAALVTSGEVTRARFDNAAAGHETLLGCLEGQAPSKVIQLSPAAAGSPASPGATGDGAQGPQVCRKPQPAQQD